MFLQGYAIVRERLIKISRSLMLRDTFIVVTFVLGLALNIFIWVHLTLNVPRGTAPIPLHYNIYFGVDFIDFRYKMYGLPILGLIVFFVHFMLIYLFYIKEKLISYFLAVNTILIHLILVAGSHIIVFLNR